jgi:plasmid replication initiation protein
MVEIKVNSELAPYLIDLKSQFTRYSLSEVLNFKSLYSIRIYQILCQWNFKEEKKYSIEELRFMLNIEAHEYTRYNDFKKDVLEKASKEINKSSTLKFAYKEVKTGRKITHIVFIIKQAVKPEKDLMPKSFEIPKQEKSEDIKEVKFIKNEEPKTPKNENFEQQNSKYEVGRHLPYRVGEEQVSNLSEQYMVLEKRLLELNFSSQRQ